MIDLTIEGKKKAKDVTGGGASHTLLCAIQENGPSSLDDLAHYLSTSPEKVKSVAIDLVKKGLVKKVG
jgi:Mn-dependent DtxR family transcriptional regulator